MMKKHFLTSLSVLALSSAIVGYAAPASATIVYITVSGTVASGSTVDTTGAFGSLGASLIGDAFTAQYEFDTSLGESYNSATENNVEGGSDWSTGPLATSPSLGASLTINNQTFLVSGKYIGFLEGINTGSGSEFVARADASSSVHLETVISGSAGASPASLTTAFTTTSAAEAHAAGVFDDGATALNLNIAIYTESLSDPTAVPEPASMALLGVGMLGTGVMARHRRSGLTKTTG